MRALGDVVYKVRSKNAGPFWVSIDIFCGDEKRFNTVCAAFNTQIFADLFAQPVHTIKRFEIVDLNVLKFSLPRPVIQGDRFDRDMHGAQWATLVAELELEGLT